MKITNGVICIVLLFFAFLQLNDPDAMVWFAIYMLAAILPGIAAAKPELLASSKPLRWLGLLAIAACVVGFVFNAGTINAEWIHVETAREAFGYVICAAAIGLALYATRELGDASLA